MFNKEQTIMNRQMMYGGIGILMLAAGMTSCSNDDVIKEDKPGYVWTTDGGLRASSGILFSDGKEDAAGTEIGNGDQEFVFKGKQTLKRGTYLLKGWVYIAEGAELTIEPGTVIKGDKTTRSALIVERGGKLFAQGTPTAPIVFTSAQPKGRRKPGDWGGVILCGRAQNNVTEMQIEGGPRTKLGGNDNADNSGVLSYVRIEFGGYPFQTDKEINGLTLGAVGSGTQIDHVQVSYSNDDSYEFFGGTVNCKYMIAYHGWDDDFDTDNGYSGKIQFGLVIRNPQLADASLSNSFESDNNADGSPVSPYTTATFSNMTFVGPKRVPGFRNTTAYVNGGTLNPRNGSATGIFQSAMQIRRNSRLNCYNSVALGYPIGLILDDQKGNTQAAATAGNMHINRVWFAGMDITGSDANKVYEDVLVTGYDSNSKPVIDRSKTSFSSTWFLAQSGNKVLPAIADLQMMPNGYMPNAGSSVLTAAAFTGMDSWFTQVNYIGAFKAGDTWLEGWTNFDPVNTDY